MPAEGTPPLPAPPMPPPVDVDEVPLAPPPEPSRPASTADMADEMVRLRREIEALKESMGAPRARPKKKAKRSARGG